MPKPIFLLVRAQFRIRRALEELRQNGRREGIAEVQLERMVLWAREAHRHALMAAHFEDLRGLLATWRYFHRWVALLMFLFVVAHVVSALRYGELFG